MTTNFNSSRWLLCGLLLFMAMGTTNAAAADKAMIVHEWGTFTALQNEQGEQLFGINIDTEPVPAFVHNFSPFILNRALLSSDHWVFRRKSVPRHHPAVSLRLETPVIYFYPPQGMKLPHTVDVEVKFRGGWLSEFYPKADVLFPVLQDGKFKFTDLVPEKTGHIVWRNLQIGTTEPGPETSEHVWLAPRQVAAAGVTSRQGEHEKYLFYRGVAKQQSPLQVVTAAKGESIVLSATFKNLLASKQQVNISKLWLMETRADGTTAYRRLEAVPVVNDDQPTRSITTARRFQPKEFNASNRKKLEAEMKEAILAEGLFNDEANALLSTWQQAYFVSPGLRVFYTVPQVWTDHILPLSISGETKITRVMIGRVELISDRQRELLNKFATTTISNGDWLAKLPIGSPQLNNLLAGRADIKDIGVPAPTDFQIYLELGRFRNALIAAEAKVSRSASIAKFIQFHELQPFGYTKSVEAEGD